MNEVDTSSFIFRNFSIVRLYFVEGYNMEIYFDNAATTKVSKVAADKMYKVLIETYGNPSSLHNKGLEAEKLVEHSRQIIATCLKVPIKDIYFTSGGTEGNNMAINGILKGYHRSGKHVLISDIEHPSVREMVLSYQDQGYEVECIPVDKKGYIIEEDLLTMLREDTILVSIMHVNNEIGTIQDLAKISSLIKKKQPKTIIHIDGVQSFGKYAFYPSRNHIDIMTISAHKLHGPKGVGAIYIGQGVKLIPLLKGGGQQSNVRPGTENVPGIVGFGVAAEEAYTSLEIVSKQVKAIKIYMITRLREEIKEIEINGDIENGAGHILNIRVKGIDSEVLLHSLEEFGIYLSAGSACSSKKKKASSTLLALGETDETAKEAIRFSFSKYNTKEEVDIVIEKMIKVIGPLRRFVRK